MTRRLVIAQFLLLAGLSLVFLLPQTPPMREAALSTDLPSWVTGGWEGGPPLEPSEEERRILASDTEFHRRNYFRPVPVEERKQASLPFDGDISDVLNAGIVLSGKDLSNSIHALERCLTAQGFTIENASTMTVRLGSGQTLPTRRLVCSRVDPRTRVAARSIAYYWFVGHDAVTGNHVTRGIRDFTDRMLRGYDQRWAYITITAYLDGIRMDEDPSLRTPQRQLSPADADRTVAEFLAEFATEVIRTDRVSHWYAE